MSYCESLFSTKGKVALVTGSGTGMGTAFAHALAKSGAKVVCAARRLDKVQKVADEIVANGGEVPAMLIVDTVIRMIPGVLGDETSSRYDSFAESGLLEYPQYTRPREFRGMKVPEVLLSGNHQEIEKWREEQSLKITRDRRKDLLPPENESGK